MQKLKDGYFKLKSYWRVPPPGYQVSYKEFFNFTVGNGSISFMSVLVQWTTLAMNIPMMISYFKVSTGMIFIFGLLGSLLGILRAPLLSMIIDNSNSKKGKFKPFLIWSTVFSGICFTLIPFIPQAWNDHLLFRFSIPQLSLFNVAASSIDLSMGVLIMFLLLQLGTFFTTLLNQSMTGIEQTISTVAQERANIGALKGLISYIPASVVNIIMPLVAGLVFAVGSTTGMNNINLYRIFFPVCAVGSLLFVLFVVYGTKERAVVNQNYVAKVKFLEGARALSTNKYFWMITLYIIALGVRANANIYFWVCTYGIGGKAGDTAIAICNMVLNNAFLPGMVLGPLLVKKFGKRNVLTVSNVGFAAIVVMQLLFVRNPYLILVCIFFQNLCNGVGFISAIMVSDVLDFQQWKSGKRLEGFWQNYHSLILTIVGLFTGTLSPLFLSFAGIGFGDNIDATLKQTDVMHGAFRYITILSLIGSVAAMAPMLFYDLTEKKHANYVRVLKIRAAVDNFEANVLQDEDVVNTQEIIAFAQDTGDVFVTEELEKYACLSSITQTYDEVRQRILKQNEKDALDEKRRVLDLEEKREQARARKKK